MHNRKQLGLLIVLCTFAFTMLPVVAQDEIGENPLLNLLRYVPDTLEYREFLIYGDPALWNERWGLDRIDSVAELNARRDPDDLDVPATLFVLPNQTSAPNAVSIQYLLRDDLRGFWGIDFFNMDRFIEAGNPPQVLTLIETSASAETLATTMTASGYTESALGDATLYSRGEDFEVDLMAEVPMTAQLGALNRIVLLDDVVIVARATAIAEASVSAVAGDVDTLADDVGFHAGALAVSDPAYGGEGDLVGAMFVEGMQTLDIVTLLGSHATPERVDALREALDIGVSLPVYDLSVFATRSRENDTQLLLAVVFPPGVDAQSATDALLMRLKRYQSLRANRPLLEIFADRGVEIEWGRGVEIDGLPVGMVSLSARNPTLQEGESGPRDTAVFAWQEMIYARDLGFMAVFE